MFLLNGSDGFVQLALPLGGQFKFDLANLLINKKGFYRNYNDINLKFYSAYALQFSADEAAIWNEKTHGAHL